MGVKAIVVGAFMVLLLSFSGCAGARGGSDTDGRSELEGRARYAEALAADLALLDELRVALSAKAPGLSWRLPKSNLETETSCGETEFEGLGAEASRALLTAGGARGAITDEEWPAAYKAFLEVAGKRGFGDPNVLADQPGKHVVSIYDKEGAEVSLGTEIGTSLSFYGACHLK